MTARLLLPAAAALALFAAAPASAQGFGYDQQGGGGAGPYALSCQRFRNYHARQRCTQEVFEGYRGYARERYDAPDYGPRYDGPTYDGPGPYDHGQGAYDNGGFYPYYGAN